jgi:hypothetical protein
MKGPVDRQLDEMEEGARVSWRRSGRSGIVFEWSIL